MAASDKYPWFRYLDGDEHRLEYGRHFSSTTKGFVNSARAAARRRGLAVRAETDGDDLILRATDDNETIRGSDRDGQDSKPENPVH